ncbi:MAG: hypothetical protein ACLP04_05985 [Solirubrobacteraceae bacterium]|jgi:hypothetical protein
MRTTDAPRRQGVVGARWHGNLLTDLPREELQVDDPPVDCLQQGPRSYCRRKREAEGQWWRTSSIVVNDDGRHSRLNGLL